MPPYKRETYFKFRMNEEIYMEKLGRSGSNFNLLIMKVLVGWLF